jgi:uncharacterized lipoprotein YajG
MKKIFLITLLSLAISCTHQNQKIDIGFHFELEKSNIANGTRVALKVFDDRVNKTILGSKKFGDEKIEITANQNLTDFFYKEISKNLTAKGFLTAKSFNLDKVNIVEIHIETLKYKAARHFPLGKSEAHSVIRVIVRAVGAKSEFTKNYTLDLTDKHFIAPLASTDAQTINSLLQETITDITEDSAFLKSLIQ